MNARSLFVLAAIACFATPAAAHAFLQHADPGAGARLMTPPRRVVLTFSERLEPASSGVTVADGAGRNVGAGPTTVAGKSMVAPVGPLGPGVYRVAWHVVSVDNHRTEGAYRFTVKP